ncbi:hypothetical protein K7A42_23825 [Agrobacterium sp. InxBP2]|uniref:hypothetical protein n=1 Tax=Agrobacterium sp. InxBP2 TaxID=2870329 RepID=UPI00249D957D|nr:hypothetical protein [Agrobacterium sp. InxBP2]MCW8283937.1 hypothetical protein [Agrobacterium sp. InxBP2]
MARVRFREDFDYRPTPQVTIAYNGGWEGTVKRECADQAVAAGKAEYIGKDAEAQKDGEVQNSR